MAFSTPHLWNGHLKLFADGSLGAGTALMHDPYADEPGNSGMHCLSPDELKHYVCQAYKRGFSVAIHAIGDKAGTHALDAIAHGRTQYPGAWRDRWNISSCLHSLIWTDTLIWA